MTTGTLITVNDRSQILRRDPIWPFPEPEEFPRDNSDGTVTHFEPRPYYRFSVGAIFIPSRKEPT